MGWLRWTSLLLMAVGCGGGGGASVDGGTPDAIDAGTPRDQRPADTGAAEDQRPAPSCSVVTTADARDLCGGAAGCVQRRAAALRCSESFAAPDFALAPDGRAFVALATQGRSGRAFLLEVPPAGAATVWPLGPAEVALVAAGQDGAPRVLLWSKDAGARLATRAGDSFTAEAVGLTALTGTPRAFAIGVAGAPLVLSTDAGGATSLTALAGGAVSSEIITTGLVSSARLFVDGAGAPTVAYAVRAGAERVHSRWTAGVTTEIRRVPATGDDDTAVALMPDGVLRLARIDRGSLMLFGDGVMERAVYQAPPWITPTCAGQMTAYYPALCPQAVEGDVDVGEQVTPRHALAASASASGGLFSAAYTAHVRVGCAWRAASCIETMPCDCRNQPYERLAAPFAFRIRPLDGTATAWTLLTPGATGVPRYAVDRGGAHHLVWHASWELTLATFELRAP
jgi:hypothetical protein